MPVILFCKATDESSALVIVSKFYGGLELETKGDSICGLEFIIEVKADSPRGITKIDIVLPNIVSDVQNLTDTFEDVNLYDNQAFTGKLRLLDAVNKKYCIDGIVAYLAPLTSNPRIEQQREYTTIRLKFNEIKPGESRAFRLKAFLPSFGKFYNSLGIFEFCIYYPAILPNQLETMEEWGTLGIPINRKLCEIWVILPQETIFRRAYPEPQQIKTNHTYHLYSHDKLDPSRHAIYWDLEKDVFDLPGRELGNSISPGKGVRIYCETTKPHVTPETFETKMGTALAELEKLIDSVKKAERSLEFIAKYGKKSFIITFLLGVFAIIVAFILAIYY